MKLISRDGSVFGDAPAELVAAAPAEINRTFRFEGVTFVRLANALRFYDVPDREAWIARGR